MFYPCADNYSLLPTSDDENRQVIAHETMTVLFTYYIEKKITLVLTYFSSKGNIIIPNIRMIGKEEIIRDLLSASLFIIAF